MKWESGEAYTPRGAWKKIEKQRQTGHNVGHMNTQAEKITGR
jgi:hypothetical protein